MVRRYAVVLSTLKIFRWYGESVHICQKKFKSYALRRQFNTKVSFVRFCQSFICRVIDEIIIIIFYSYKLYCIYGITNTFFFINRFIINVIMTLIKINKWKNIIYSKYKCGYVKHYKLCYRFIYRGHNKHWEYRYKFIQYYTYTEDTCYRCFIDCFHTIELKGNKISLTRCKRFIVDVYHGYNILEKQKTVSFNTRVIRRISL